MRRHPPAVICTSPASGGLTSPGRDAGRAGDMPVGRPIDRAPPARTAGRHATTGRPARRPRCAAAITVTRTRSRRRPAPPSPSRPDRRSTTPRAALPSTNAAVFRSETTRFLLDALTPTSRVRAADPGSTDHRPRGRAIAVSGTVLVAHHPGSARAASGHRLRPSTQGMVDRVRRRHGSPPRAPRTRAPASRAWLRGYAVAMPDDEGVGTAGVTPTWTGLPGPRHAATSYVPHSASTGTGLNSNSPVGTDGYPGRRRRGAPRSSSPRRTPRTCVKGAVVGAVPADLAKVATDLDGGRYAAVRASRRGLGRATRSTSRPTSDRSRDQRPGRERVRLRPPREGLRSRPRCSASGAAHVDAGRPSRLRRSSSRAARSGRLKPSAPVLVTHSALDDASPTPGAGRWPGRGAARAPTSRPPATSPRSTWSASCRRRPRPCRSSRRVRRAAAARHHRLLGRHRPRRRPGARGDQRPRHRRADAEIGYWAHPDARGPGAARQRSTSRHVGSRRARAAPLRIPRA